MKSVSRTALYGMLLMMLPGLAYGFSAFSQPLAASYNWPPLSIATVFGINIFFNALGALAGGSIVDRFGSRYTTMAGAILIGLGEITVGLATPIIQYPGFLIGFGLITGFGGGLVSVSAITAIMRTRSDGYGLGGALAVFGYGLGQLVYGLIIHATPSFNRVAVAASKVIKAASGVGDSTTHLAPMPPERIAELSMLFMVSGAVAMILGVIVASRLPGKLGPQLGTRRSIGFFDTIWTGQAWLTWLCWLVAAVGSVAIFAQALPILSDVTHKPTAELTKLLTMYAVAACIGRISLGTLADYYGFRRMLGTAFGLLAASLFVIGSSHDPLIAIVAFGFAYLTFGGIAGLLMGWTAKSFGTEHFGVNWGWINTAFGIAGLCGPWFVGMFHQITGSYAGALLPIGFLVAGGALLPMIMREDFHGSEDGSLPKDGVSTLSSRTGTQKAASRG